MQGIIPRIDKLNSVKLKGFCLNSKRNDHKNEEESDRNLYCMRNCKN